jgi:glutathione peroxidase-family protein
MRFGTKPAVLIPYAWVPFVAVLLLLTLPPLVSGIRSRTAFAVPTHTRTRPTVRAVPPGDDDHHHHESVASTDSDYSAPVSRTVLEWTVQNYARRNMVSVLVGGTVLAIVPGIGGAGTDDNNNSNADNESFASIASRANVMSKKAASELPATASGVRATDQTCYDFSLPVAGLAVPMATLINQVFYDSNSDEARDGEAVKVKAVVVVNIKQDDPVARKTIPELISLATKYSGRDGTGAVAIVCCPTDQGYYEPDTSALLRLKLGAEYGYGINPATIVTDKVNLLGTGAHPFWRWLQSTSRTPAGLGRIEGNFEKFLIDGRTGLPVRRYPRKYAPLNLQDDVEALIATRPLPPAKANFLEAWRAAAAEAERDTYRFEKGLNVFDQ